VGLADFQIIIELKSRIKYMAIWLITIFIILPASIGAFFAGGDMGRRAKVATLSVIVSIVAVIIIAIAKEDGQSSSGPALLTLAILILAPYLIGSSYKDYSDKKDLKFYEEEHKLKTIDEARRRVEHRDAISQKIPYRYKIGRHAKETLALRYGIPHVRSERDNGRNDLEEIAIKKLRHIEKSRFEAELTDYRNRIVIAVIEPGTDYVKTFYPKEGQNWWKENKDWEDKLNPSYSSKSFFV
jgi:hypothetical protein